MINDIEKQLKDVIDYFRFNNKNLTKKQDYKIEELKDILEKINKINVWYEVCRCEVVTAIEDINNDGSYRDYQGELDKLNDKEINRIAWKVYDEDIWEEIYQSAREELIEELELE
jgi:hypothetical protein